MSSPKVSVIVPVFNGERFLSEALGSLRPEQEPELEILVVDDGSTDGSIGIVQALAGQDPRIVLIEGEHRGVSAARNVGVRAASGEYITFLDCDDLCPPGRIARQLQKLIMNPDAAAIVGETLWFEALTPDFKPVPGTRFLRIITVTLHSALFARAIFDQHGFFDEALAHCEDLDFFIRLAEAEVPLLVENEIASLYRRHDGNMTRDNRRMQKATLTALQRSIARRRATGRLGPIDRFVLQGVARELLSKLKMSEPANAAAAGVPEPLR
jgi:glycosyltransferase involved in cell wall biosynthesis